MRNHIVITSVLFVIIGLLHAIRAWFGLPLVIGSTYISSSVSWVVAIVLLFLAANGIYRLHKR